MISYTHRNAFGTTGGDETYDTSLAKQTLEQIKKAYPRVFTEPSFPIERENQPLLEHKIPLKDPKQPPPRRKIYPLDSEELAALKKEIEKLLESYKTQRQSLWGTNSLCKKERWWPLHVY